MRGFIRILGIVLGLTVIGIVLYLIPGDSIWETHNITGVIEKTAVLLVLLSFAALLLASERSYQKESVRNIAEILVVISAVAGAFATLYLLGHSMNAVLADEPDPESYRITLFRIVAGILVSFASAAVLFARVSMARKSSRERSAHPSHS